MLYGNSAFMHVTSLVQANVMLEYSYDEGIKMLTKNKDQAVLKLKEVNEDLEFLRDQIITAEVNIARIFNYDVRRRRQVHILLLCLVFVFLIGECFRKRTQKLWPSSPSRCLFGIFHVVNEAASEHTLWVDSKSTNYLSLFVKWFWWCAAVVK